jgi:SsrA-binding protein
VGEKTITVNRKAQHDYQVMRTLEAGLSLLGSEIKSIREGKASIREAYVRPDSGDVWLIGAHIAKYAPAASANHEPTRRRRLLLHKRQIHELARAVESEGVTIIPLRLYLKNGMAKLEIAVARGKKRYDKRAAIAKRDAERQIQRALRRRT